MQEHCLQILKRQCKEANSPFLTGSNMHITIPEME